MTPEVWPLSVWLCAGPDHAGECALTGPAMAFEIRRACRAEAVRRQREGPAVIGRCRKRRGRPGPFPHLPRRHPPSPTLASLRRIGAVQTQGLPRSRSNGPGSVCRWRWVERGMAAEPSGRGRAVSSGRNGGLARGPALGRVSGRRRSSHPSRPPPGMSGVEGAACLVRSRTSAPSYRHVNYYAHGAAVRCTMASRASPAEW